MFERVKRKHAIDLIDYDCFEQVRKHSDGGGILTAVHKSLNPLEIPTDDDYEILVIVATLENVSRHVRFINGYGQQEYSPEILLLTD